MRRNVIICVVVISVTAIFVALKKFWENLVEKFMDVTIMSDPK